MTVVLDHFLVVSRDQRAAARLLAELLGVPWAAEGVGPFSAVFVNDGLTLDFIDATPDRPLVRQHCCFRVSPEEFDAILGRLQAAGIPYRSRPTGPVDNVVNRQGGGKNVYWSEPDGHAWEMLTVSYARQPPRTA
jgi:hypothetical protein